MGELLEVGSRPGAAWQGVKRRRSVKLLPFTSRTEHVNDGLGGAFSGRFEYNASAGGSAHGGAAWGLCGLEGGWREGSGEVRSVCLLLQLPSMPAKLCAAGRAGDGKEGRKGVSAACN